MTEIGSGSRAPQQRQALQHANHVRRVRADLKRQIADGTVSAAQVILLCADETTRWSVQDLLMCQQHWGRKRCQAFLQRNQIGELKVLGDLTERQRQLLADQLNGPSPNSATSARASQRTSS